MQPRRWGRRPPAVTRNRIEGERAHPVGRRRRRRIAGGRVRAPAVPVTSRSRGPRRSGASDAAATPRENLLLASLPAAEYRRVAAALQCHELLPGDVARATFARRDRLHFLGRGLVSVVRGGNGRPPVGVALIGCEGAIGLGLLTRAAEDASRSIEPHTAVRTWSLPAAVARREFVRGGRLQRNLLRFGHSLLEQVVGTTVCRSRHAVDEQLRCWLLHALARLPGPEIPVTQEVVARMIGVRRASVTEALARLEGEGSIVRARGRVRIIDRGALAAGACACYRSTRNDYQALRRDLAGA